MAENKADSLVSETSVHITDVKSSETRTLQEIAEGLLIDATTDISTKRTISVPLSELSTLGTGVSSLMPAFNTVTQTTSISASGLYKLANAEVGDTLKVAKNGNFWGAFKTADGTSKFAQLQAADSLTATTSTVMPFNPATIMMAAALYSIEKELSDIEKTGKEIISFLETEKESEIEADIETLISIIKKYKYNWDNEHFVTSNHKLVLDIQRTARKNMNSYQKKVAAAINSKMPVVMSAQVDTTLEGLIKKFKYYRLSLYVFSLASLLEILLSGDFKEENISYAKGEIEQRSMAYRELFGQCSAHIEKLSNASMETNVLKGVGSAGDTLGKIIGSIPIVKNGPVDEILQKGGNKLKQNAAGIEEKAVKSFASISNPETGLFVEKMNDMIQIYNQTEEIFFDDKQIYLASA